uniref:Folate/biopterin transporter n=1 Tax=Oxyrrhis marina TaxID=2969 RepID=A0A7S4LQI3_OXYMA
MALPGASLVRWLRRLNEGFGPRLLITLLLVHGVLKGFCGGGGTAGLAGTPVDFLLREFSVDASSMQVFSAAVFIPWSVKPVMGFVSDAFPICGYHRLPYFALSTVAALVSYIALPLFPSLPLEPVLVLLFVIIFHMSISDLLAEAVYSRRIREVPALGPDLVSFVWACIGVGKLISVSFVGWIMDEFGYRSPYVASVPFVALVLLIPFLNLIDEPRQESRCKPVSQDPALTLVALVTGFGALGLSIMSLMGCDLVTKIFAATALAAIVLLLFSIVLSPVIARVNAFFFVQSLCALSIGGASFYFFTDDAEAYPEGPHFSTMFYATVLGLVSTAFSMVGVIAYTHLMKAWKYRKVLLVGNMAFSAVNMLSCIVFLRWNVAWGISDHAFVLCSSAVQTAIFEMAWLPGILIMSQLCPEGCEATMFALLAGAHNLGANLGSYSGAMLLRLLHVEPRGSPGESAQFDNLWLAAAIAAIGPCIPLALLPVLMPDVSQQDRIEGVDHATEGSLWSRWSGNSFGMIKKNSNLELRSIVGASSLEAPYVAPE